MCKGFFLASLEEGLVFSHWLGCVRIYLAGQVGGHQRMVRGPTDLREGWVQAQLCRFDTQGLWAGHCKPGTSLSIWVYDNQAASAGADLPHPERRSASRAGKGLCALGKRQNQPPSHSCISEKIYKPESLHPLQAWKSTKIMN